MHIKAEVLQLEWMLNTILCRGWWQALQQRLGCYRAGLTPGRRRSQIPVGSPDSEEKKVHPVGNSREGAWLNRNPVSCLQQVAELPLWEQQPLRMCCWMPRGTWNSCSNCSRTAWGGCNSAGHKLVCLQAQIWDITASFGKENTALLNN